MPHVSLLQDIILLVITGAFVLFGVTLFCVSLYVTMGPKRREAKVQQVERRVIPARRVSSAH